MKVMLLVALLASALGTFSLSDRSGSCASGQAEAFAAIQKDPPYLVGTIPNSFTGNPRFFSRRFNCHGASALVRRVSQGLYDVEFPQVSVRLALATAISDEGVSVSIWPLGQGIVRVALRGPLGGADVATRRDVAFSIVVY